LARNDGNEHLESPMTVTVFIRYQLDPFKRARSSSNIRRTGSPSSRNAVAT
jgi:hypothetical protein